MAKHLDVVYNTVCGVDTYADVHVCVMCVYAHTHTLRLCCVHARPSWPSAVGAQVACIITT